MQVRQDVVVEFYGVPPIGRRGDWAMDGAPKFPVGRQHRWTTKKTAEPVLAK
jgi:hypothetical protein